eukprot:TRINITY_DN30171_c0_g1_i1.p1 TRINITY_DN30171_c0_g1~~TRINITY_DN30171_c0_g1_i1.p1  ORF type:complete len:234 (-),score=43.60 TRINITY_DN30171_c0_g1_i1:44-679(-)
MVAVLNVLTGMFVDCAMKVSEIDQGAVLDAIMEDPAELQHIQELRHRLRACDPSGHGKVEWEDIYRVLTYSQDETTNFLKALGVEPMDLKRIFKSLAGGEQGATGKPQTPTGALTHPHMVNADDFVNACTAVGMESPGIGIVALTAESQKHLSQTRALMNYVEGRFDEINALLQPLGVARASRAPSATFRDDARALSSVRRAQSQISNVRR